MNVFNLDIVDWLFSADVRPSRLWKADKRRLNNNITIQATTRLKRLSSFLSDQQFDLSLFAMCESAHVNISEQQRLLTQNPKRPHRC